LSNRGACGSSFCQQHQVVVNYSICCRSLGLNGQRNTSKGAGSSIGEPMKRPLVIIAVVSVALAFALQASAAPQSAPSVARDGAARGSAHLQEPRPVIAQPEQDAVVRGVVQLVGSAVHPQFQRYELYYAPWPVTSDQAWIFIGDAHFQQQPLGLLGTWDSRSVPDGAYGLRVRVVKQDGNYNDSEPRRVVVANIRPVATATPIATAAQATAEPTELPTALPATATIVVEVPAIQSPTPIATATPKPTASPGIAGGAGQGTTLADVEGILSPGRFVDIAEKAAIYTLGFFLVIGLFFSLKALLVWLVHRIRP
jgi:hypothetical protein